LTVRSSLQTITLPLSLLPRVARLALLEPKKRNLAFLRISWLQNFYLATFWLFCNFFVPQIFLGEEFRVVRVAEMSIGPDLDWIRTIANFVEFGLDPGCKTLQN